MGNLKGQQMFFFVRLYPKCGKLDFVFCLKLNPIEKGYFQYFEGKHILAIGKQINIEQWGLRDYNFFSWKTKEEKGSKGPFTNDVIKFRPPLLHQVEHKSFSLSLRWCKCSTLYTGRVTSFINVPCITRVVNLRIWAIIYAGVP